MQHNYIESFTRHIEKYMYCKGPGELQHHAEIVTDCTDTPIGIVNKIKKHFETTASFYELRAEKIITNDGKRHIISIWYRVAPLPTIED